MRVTVQPMAVIPIPSDHGDIHTIRVTRSDGKSVTFADYAAIFAAINGRELREDEALFLSALFAEEDR